MYRKILLPTDGSLLSDAAIAQGVELAKSMGATLVGMTVTAPFHTFALDPLMVSDTKESYKKDCEALATKYLDAIKAVASAAGVPCEVTHVDSKLDPGSGLPLRDDCPVAAIGGGQSPNTGCPP